MTDKELDEKSDDLMRLFFSFCDDAELDKYIIVEHDQSSNKCHERFTESGEYLLATIKKWLKDNVTTEAEWEGEKARLWTPWTKN